MRRWCVHYSPHHLEFLSHFLGTLFAYNKTRASMYHAARSRPLVKMKRSSHPFDPALCRRLVAAVAVTSQPLHGDLHSQMANRRKGVLDPPVHICQRFSFQPLQRPRSHPNVEIWAGVRLLRWINTACLSRPAPNVISLSITVQAFLPDASFSIVRVSPGSVFHRCHQLMTTSYVVTRLLELSAVQF